MDVWKIFTIVSFVFVLVLGVGVYGLHLKIDSFAKEFDLPLIPIAEDTVPYVIPELATTTDTVATTTNVTTSEEEDFVTSSPALFTLFSDLLSSVSFPNTSVQEKLVSITGDETADDVINTLAEDAGYIRQPIATTTLVVLEGYRVQPQVKFAWEELKASATLSGINLGIVSGYRSPEAQKALFNKYFREETRRSGFKKDFTTKDIKDGKADAVILSTLKYAAPPGYSRHHSGYTIDIRDVDSGFSFYEFGKTRGYRWVSRNNYEGVRKYGFIPSYPRGERDGGPEPEPWELVWIGVEKIETLDLDSI